MLLTSTGDNTEQVKRLYRQSPIASIYPKAERIIGKDEESGALVTYHDAANRRAIEN